MKHLGSITDIHIDNAAMITNVVIGGSPCQDLSIAGERKGLAGSRSGLFMEQIRIVKEMREYEHETKRRCFRFMVWEQVPGALSSNKGEDFRRVLEEIVHVCDESVIVPRPEKGKWKPAGAIMGDNYSVAWRVLDARWFGVPQRRKRIALVADFTGRSAPEILFVEKSLRGNSETSSDERKAASANSETSSGTANDGIILDDQGGSVMTVITDGIAPTLRAQQHGHQPLVMGFDGYNSTLTGAVSSTLGVNCGMSTGRNGVLVQEDFHE